MGVVGTEDSLLDLIRQSGLRVTMARRAICRILADSDDEFLTASSIHERVAADAGGVDASTVYRTLDELERIGIVHHVHLGSGQPGTWHLTIDRNHQHLMCERCGKTSEVAVSHLEPTYALLREQHDFRPNAHHFTILGYCGDCLEALAKE